jgi:hypothetical protein
VRDSQSDYCAEILLLLSPASRGLLRGCVAQKNVNRSPASHRIGCHRMRVLVLTNMYPSEERPIYGIFVREQAEDLRKLGVDVKVLAFAGHSSWFS